MGIIIWGLSQGDIARTLTTNHGIIISERHLRRVLKSLHLERRKDYTDIGEVASFIQKMLNTSGQQHGYRWCHGSSPKAFSTKFL